MKTLRMKTLNLKSILLPALAVMSLATVAASSAASHGDHKSREVITTQFSSIDELLERESKIIQDYGRQANEVFVVPAFDSTRNVMTYYVSYSKVIGVVDGLYEIHNRSELIAVWGQSPQFTAQLLEERDGVSYEESITDGGNRGE